VTRNTGTHAVCATVHTCGQTILHQTRMNAPACSTNGVSSSPPTVPACASGAPTSTIESKNYGSTASGLGTDLRLSHHSPETTRQDAPRIRLLQGDYTMARTRIGIIGAGNMGRAFATRLAAAGHSVTITATDPAHAEEAAAKAGANARAVRPEGIARDTDLLILAVPYAAAAEALRGAGDVSGKTIVDITNPVTPDYSALALGFSTSAAEEIQKAVPTAKVVKAFNTVFAQVLGSGARAQVLYAGDDAGAKEAVRELIESAGFEAVDAGPLANARLLEPLGMLTIYFGYGAGRGTGIAPAWQQIA
jgi:8-hydroxy-5-deazaflavin:NADPH oxidoreductase